MALATVAAKPGFILAGFLFLLSITRFSLPSLAADFTKLVESAIAYTAWFVAS